LRYDDQIADRSALLLAYKKLPWQSVIIPAVMPKPDVVALTGGYRRTPVMQIGADIYCDTALMAQVIERIAPQPAILGTAAFGAAQILADWADSALFWTAVPFAFQPAAMAEIFAGVPPEAQAAFGKDRAAMRAGARRPALPELRADLVRSLALLEAQLAHGHGFLMGPQPLICDFSVYGPLWYIKRLNAVSAVFDPYPRLLEWLARMAGFGKGYFEKLSSAQAIEVAATSTPATNLSTFINSHGIALGSEVVITPTDYAFDPVRGVLVVCSEDTLAVSRTDPRAGNVVVHFPRHGYEMKFATP
jgi:glutathione S-transferase